MSGLEDSHISAAEMLKKIRSVAHEEGWPVLICRTARVRLCLFKLGFDDLLSLVNDVLASVAAYVVFMVRLLG